MYDDNEWQTQISGKAKIGETMVDAAQREIFEEIGIAFDTNTIYNSYLDYEKFKGCDVAYFSVPLGCTVFMPRSCVVRLPIPDHHILL